jgi:hypothetical protein
MLELQDGQGTRLARDLLVRTLARFSEGFGTEDITLARKLVALGRPAA